MILEHYAIYVGPYIYAEYSPPPSQDVDEHYRALGEFITMAVAAGHRRYGPSHEARVVYRQGQIVE